MDNGTSRTEIRAALAAMPGNDLAPAAQRLLDTLGYRSQRTLDNQSGAVDGFITTFPTIRRDGTTATEPTQSERAFRDQAASVRIIFQFTNTEIAAAAAAQRALFEDDAFDSGNAQSFMFTAVELKQNRYPRGQYARFTREINKRLSQPTVVLFRTASGLLTLAFVHRRPHKYDPDRDVLGNVSLIREIDPGQPHRAHLDILAELSLPERLDWINSHGQAQNFDGLLSAWLDALDTEALNKRFYKELFDWYQRAVEEAQFPTTGAKVLPPEEHVIRLITRLLFVWFVKEKGLIADDLFNETRVGRLLQDYDSAGGDSYYRAVLQNLFFATLNTEIGQRGFSARTQVTHRNFSRYRYRREMRDPDALLALFRRTPFINGGLFDCLDSEESTGDGGYRIDCFTDNPGQRRDYSIPNRLFFDRDAQNPGLITLFNRYKFTVEENTPAEQEVALDPELLGKVFENLLAAVNPETRETARRQTGSYYTPRAVVDYMVDEALVASLAATCPPADGDDDFWQERLRYLLDYADAFDDAEELFYPQERAGIIRAIANLKVIDPAVGSGAFPMGILHKLTLALRRLDADNRRWESLQKELAGQQATAAFNTPDQQERDAELTEISDTFQKYRDSDFGRKLYLIQNSIFGVDIQPIACQIAKLRFFISLAIEQEPDNTAPNYGIKPLPNLETRFVAANTLLALDKPLQMSLGQTAAVTGLEQALNANRERHFHATTRQQKLACRRADQRLRRQLAAALREADFSAADARKLARWDPYDQNDKADWFDAEYMFGLTAGFDVVIGNPPYVQLQKEGGKLARRYQDAGYTTFARTGDIYQLFCEQGCRLLTPQWGLLSFITSNSWLRAQYGQSTRRYFAEQQTPLRLLEMGKDVFENTIVDTSILIARQGKSDTTGKAIDMDRLPDKSFPPAERLWGPFRPPSDRPWSALSAIEQPIMGKMAAAGTPLKDWDVSINYGIKTGYNTAFIIDDATRQALVAADEQSDEQSDKQSDEIIKPILRGRDIQRYQAQWANLWLIDTHNGYGDVPAINVDDYPAIKSHLDGFYPRLKKRQDKGRTPYNLRSCAYHEDFAKEKLIYMDMSSQGRFSYSDTEMYNNDKAYILTGHSLKYLCAVLNSTLITWMMKNTALTTGMGVTQWKKFAVERLPIPKITVAEQRPFVRLVDRILRAKAADPAADTGEWEAEIDRLVYALYGLSDEEVAAVAG